MNKSENIDQLAAALAIAQGEFSEAVKEGKSHHGKHATLTSVWEAARKPLSANGLAVLQAPYVQEGRVNIITLLVHKSGQWIETELSIKPARDDAQQIGSAITYGRRYALAPILGIVNDEDDDGNAASGKDKNGQMIAPSEGKQTTFGESKKSSPIGPLLNSNSKKIFDKFNLVSADWVKTTLWQKKIPSTKHDTFIDELHGKDMLTELQPQIQKYLDEETPF